MSRRHAVMWWLVLGAPLAACSDDPTTVDPIVPGPPPTEPPCFTDLRAADFELAPDPGGAALTRAQRSSPDVQMHVGGMTGPQHLRVAAAYADGLPEQEFACKAVRVKLTVRAESATACLGEEVEVKATWDRFDGCDIAAAELVLEEASMSALRVIGRATGLGRYNIKEGRNVEITVEPIAE